MVIPWYHRGKNTLVKLAQPPCILPRYYHEQNTVMLPRYNRDNTAVKPMHQPTFSMVKTGEKLPTYQKCQVADPSRIGDPTRVGSEFSQPTTCLTEKALILQLKELAP